MRAQGLAELYGDAADPAGGTAGEEPLPRFQPRLGPQRRDGRRTGGEGGGLDQAEVLRGVRQLPGPTATYSAALPKRRPSSPPPANCGATAGAGEQAAAASRRPVAHLLQSFRAGPAAPLPSPVRLDLDLDRIHPH